MKSVLMTAKDADVSLSPGYRIFKKKQSKVQYGKGADSHSERQLRLAFVTVLTPKNNYAVILRKKKIIISNAPRSLAFLLCESLQNTKCGMQSAALVDAEAPQKSFTDPDLPIIKYRKSAYIKEEKVHGCRMGQDPLWVYFSSLFVPDLT